MIWHLSTPEGLSAEKTVERPTAECLCYWLARLLRPIKSGRHGEMGFSCKARQVAGGSVGVEFVEEYGVFRSQLECFDPLADPQCRG